MFKVSSSPIDIECSTRYGFVLRTYRFGIMELARAYTCRPSHVCVELEQLLDTLYYKKIYVQATFFFARWPLLVVQVLWIIYFMLVVYRRSWFSIRSTSYDIMLFMHMGPIEQVLGITGFNVSTLWCEKFVVKKVAMHMPWMTWKYFFWQVDHLFRYKPRICEIRLCFFQG